MIALEKYPCDLFSIPRFFVATSLTTLNALKNKYTLKNQISPVFHPTSHFLPLPLALPHDPPYFCAIMNSLSIF